REIAGLRPDVLHSNGVKAHVLAGAADRATPLVVHLHDFVSSRAASRHLLRWIPTLRGNTLFVANSLAVADDFRAVARNARIRVVHNAIDTDRFSPGPARLPVLAPAAPQAGSDAVTF